MYEWNFLAGSTFSPRSFHIPIGCSSSFIAISSKLCYIWRKACKIGFTALAAKTARSFYHN